MPVNDRISQVYITDGTTKRFDFTFRLFSQEDADGIMVRKKTLLGFDSVDKNLYSVVGNIGDEGGYVMFTTAPVAGQFLYIIGSTAVEQSLSITNYGNFNAHSLERVLDKIIAILQERQGDLTQEQQARVVADVYYDDLAKVREEDLKNYVDGIIGSITGQPFIGIADNFIQVKQSLTGSVDRSQHDKNSDTINALDFGILPNINVDQSAKIQNAFNEVSEIGVQKTLHFPAGRYRVDNTLNIPIGLSIVGESYPMYNGGNQHGTFFHLNHTGVGFDATGATGVRYISRIATMRNQPDPNGETFTPNAHDWDFKFRSCVDIYMRDCLLLNPTKGIIFTHDGVSGANRFNLDNIVMQTFGVGVQVDYCYDVSRFDGLHFWPFWSTAPAVQRWMQNNTEVIISKRNDNPIFTRIFSIWHKSGIRIAQAPTLGPNLVGGSTSKLKLSDCDFDIGNTGYTVDADVTNHTAFWTNVSMQGINPDANPANNLPLIFIGGSNVSINATNTDLALAMGNAVRDTGTNNIFSFNGLNVQSFNQGGGGFPAFELNGTLYVSGRFTVTAENSASVFGGTGNYFADYWRSFNPSITTTTGTITSLTVLVCRWRMTRTHVDFELDFIINDNGTGAGILRCSLPITPPNFATLVGREVQISGATLTGTVSSGNNNIEIGTTDNSYPGATGARIVINGSYSLNN